MVEQEFLGVVIIPFHLFWSSTVARVDWAIKARCGGFVIAVNLQIKTSLPLKITIPWLLWSGEPLSPRRVPVEWVLAGGSPFRRPG